MIIVILILLLLLVPQEPKIVTCTVVKVDQSVSCPTENGMELFTFTEATEAREIFNEWRLRAPFQGGRVNTDAPLYTVPVKVGDKVKAIVEGGKFREIGECNVRVYRNIKHWRMFREGERVPNMLFTLPDDCQPWHGKIP
jgi:hypothetical protein